MTFAVNVICRMLKKQKLFSKFRNIEVLLEIFRGKYKKWMSFMMIATQTQVVWERPMIRKPYCSSTFGSVVWQLSLHPAWE